MKNIINLKFCIIKKCSFWILLAFFWSLLGNQDLHLTNVNINVFVENGTTSEDVLKTKDELKKLALDIYEKDNEKDEQRSCLKFVKFSMITKYYHHFYWTIKSSEIKSEIRNALEYIEKNYKDSDDGCTASNPQITRSKIDCSTLECDLIQEMI